MKITLLATLLSISIAATAQIKKEPFQLAAILHLQETKRSIPTRAIQTKTTTQHCFR